MSNCPFSLAFGSTLFVLPLVAVLVCWPQASAAQDADAHQAWLPPTDELDALAERLASLSPDDFAADAAAGRARASDCRLEDRRLECRCVEVRDDDLVLRAERWDERGQSAVFEGLQAHFEGSRGQQTRYFAERWRVRRDDAPAHQIDRLDVSKRHPLSLLTIEQVRLGGSDPVQFSNLAWRGGPATTDTSACGFQRPVADGEPAVRADEIYATVEAWKVEGFRLAGLPVYPPGFDADELGPVSGFLPPSLAFSDGTLEATAAYLWSDWRVAPHVVVAPTDWYGVGLGLVDRPLDDEATPPFEPSSTPLDLQLRYSQASESVNAAAIGESSWGGPHAHLSAAAELVGDERFWRTGRLGREATFRPWRFSRAGVARSGPGHFLRAGVVHPQSIDLRSFEGREELAGAHLQAAVSHTVADKTTADFELRHATLVDGGGDRHATVLRAGLERVIGARDRAYMRPALRGWFATGFDTSQAGISAASSAQIVGAADAGIGFEGSLLRARHRFEPALVFARELAGVSRVADEAAAAWTGAQREPKWTMGGLVLRQSLDFESAWRIELPTGVLYEGGGFTEAFERRPWGLAGLKLRHRELEAAGYAVCDRLCESVSWTAGGRAGVGPFELTYASSLFDDTRLEALQWDASLGEGWSFLRAFQGDRIGAFVDGESDAVHRAALAWRHARWRTVAQTYWRPSRGATGLSVGNTWAVPELGWAVGVRADWRTEPEELGLFVGLSRPH